MPVCGFKPESAPLKSLAKGEMAKLQVPDKPRPEPDAVFNGPQGQALHLADFTRRSADTEDNAAYGTAWATLKGSAKTP